MVAAGVLFLSGPPSAPGGRSAAARGGQLVASFRSEPRSFNRHIQAAAADELFSRLTAARLVRLNRVTDEIEPRLAQRWTLAGDGLTYTLELRQDVRFSDGAPFSSADVLFSFRAVYDEAAASVLADELKIAGQPLDVSAPGPNTVVIRFPSPFGPGLRILDGLPILPRHKLEAALDEGRFREAWGTTTAPGDMAGLGPFVLDEFTPGQRLVFVRNPNYWVQDADGVGLPYLDRLVVESVADENAEVLRLEAGQIDLMTSEARPEDVAAFREAAAAGRLQLIDVGIGRDPNLMWINLRPDARMSDTRRAWLQSEDFRKAISHAVDRDVFVNTVYLGAAVPLYGPITPGFGSWYVPDLPTYAFDRDRARALLAGLGLADRTGDGMLDDRAGAPVRFSLITQRGSDTRERGAAVIQDQLRQVGIAVDVVGLDQGTIIQRYGPGDFEAIYFFTNVTDPDPSLMSAFWLSKGYFHFWNPGQANPATAWERRIDELMGQLTSSIDDAERHRLFAEAQRLFAEHVPALYFAAPRVYVAMSPRVLNAQLAVGPPQVLWNAEVLAMKEGG